MYVKPILNGTKVSKNNNRNLFFNLFTTFYNS